MVNSNLNQLLSYLECPETRKPLIFDGNEFVSVSEENKIRYPNINGVPWLIRSPQAHWIQWKNRIRAKWIEWDQLSKKIESDLTNENLSPVTKKRLQSILEGIEINTKSTKKLFQHLISDMNLQNELIHIYGEKVPGNQMFTSYFQNIFRDWVWGSNENQIMIETLKSMAPGFLGSTLVCGAGSGRLVKDFTEALNPPITFAIDINPMLMTVANKMFDGRENITLSEFPVAPIEVDSVAPIHTFCSKPLMYDNLYCLYSDAMNLPFKANIIDTVITPWFIDIIPMDFKVFAKKINRILKIGGSWLNVGPLGFQQTDSKLRYSRDEIIFQLEEAGFKIQINETQRVPYLQSPYSGHWRVEKVLTFQVVKIKDIEAPSGSRYIPNWLSNLDHPIPKTDELAQAISIHRIYFEILSSIDGVNSVNILAEAMSKHYKMDPNLALDSLLMFLMRFWENQQ